MPLIILLYNNIITMTYIPRVTIIKLLIIANYTGRNMGHSLQGVA